MDATSSTEFPHLAGDEDEDAYISSQEQEIQKLYNSGEKDSITIIKPTRCRGCTVYVEPLIFFMMLCNFPLIIINPQFILKRELEKYSSGGNSNFTTNTSSCQKEPIWNVTAGFSPSNDHIVGNYSLAQSAASYFALQTSLVSSVPAMFAVMFLGPYSDKKGRKFAIIPPLFGSAIASFVYVLVSHFHLPIEFILVGNFIYGCTGYWTTLFMGAISFITDITTKENRQFRIVISEVCMIAPTILSSAGSGFWVKAFGFTTVYFTVFCINALLVVFAICVIPETVKPDPKAKFFSTAHMKKAITVFAVDDDTKRRWKLLVLLAALFFCMLVSLGGNITTLFVMNYPLCWGTELIGIQSSITMAVGVIGSATLAKLLGCFLRDAAIATVAGVMDVARYVYMFFVTTTTMMLASAVFNITFVVFTPTLRAMFSKLVKPGEVGAVFSGIAFLELLCGLLGQAIFNPIYSTTQEMGMPNLVFLVMCCFSLSGTIIMIIYSVLTRGSQTRSLQVQVESPN